MCGIVGYVGHEKAVDVLIGGLQRLEYRGYDSAGIAVLNQGGMHLARSVGKVRQLADLVYRDWDAQFIAAARVGIAHTRWATHGPPIERNAHPQVDGAGRIAMVHNGIIENYKALQQRLQADGHVFKSDTDSEVLAHLIGEYYTDGNDLLRAVCAALGQVEGTYGIAVLACDQPDRLVVARRGSPIVLGLGHDETIVASDASAIVAHTDQVIYLNDDDVAVVGADGVEMRNIHNVPVSREVSRIDWDAKAAEKDGFDHFMLKEIFEQPEALRNTIRGRLDQRQATAIISGLALSPREMADIQRVVLMGCGTSLHAAMVGEYFFEDLADLPADVEQAAEFRYRNPIIQSRDLAIAISQSGETADTLAAVREAKHKGALVAGVCNVVGSTIARETGLGVYLHAGPEIGVASTKAFTSQLLVLFMMALKFGRCRRLSREVGLGLCDEIEKIPELVRKVIDHNDLIAEVAAAYSQAEDFFYIGRGYLYPAALEGALKLKEISYIHAEGYHAAELKHGPIALLQENVPVMALLCDVPGKEKTVGNVEECKARRAPVVAIVTEGDEAAAEYADHAIPVPRTSKYLAPLVSVVAMQIFAYHVARLRGCEIDQPRNLAKSVTVE